jgi:hypothetical protein
MNDLGTCRRYDLFVTDPSLKPIDDFQIVDFVQEKTQLQEDLEKLYNTGEVTDIMEDHMVETFSNILPESLLEDVSKAFGDAQDRKERLKGMSLADLI